jgi:hypothetical protein
MKFGINALVLYEIRYIHNLFPSVIRKVLMTNQGNRI